MTKVNYPSGRIVTYYRDTMGRIDKITTKKTSADASVNVATVITYQPLSRLVKSFTYSNGLTETGGYTNDYELSQCQVKNGSTAILDSSYFMAARRPGAPLQKSAKATRPAKSPSRD